MNIALLTDFGTSDYFVAAMKGVILTIEPKVTIVDITHEIRPQNIGSGAFVLSACYRDFPANCIFVAVVDPGVGSERKAILVSAGGYHFIAPDNGILSYVLDSDPNWTAFEITNEKYRRSSVSSTFHGRDIFAPAAAYLATGVLPSDLGPQMILPVRLPPLRPERISRTILHGEIIHTDRFGNLVTNLKREDLGENFVVEIGNRHITQLREYFADAHPGELFLIEGSAGFVEIAVRDGSALSDLGVETGSGVILQLPG